MMKERTAHVTAQAFNRHSGTPMAPAPRTEQVNLRTNSLFASCECLMDVKRAYESFWNELNPDSREVVFVHSILLT